MIAAPFEFKLITEKDSGMKWFDKLEIVFVLEGTGRILLDKRHYNFNKTDIFLVNGFEPRDISMSSGSVALGLYIDYDFVTNSSPEISNPYFECKSFQYVENEQLYFDDLRSALARAFKSYYKNESSYSVVMRSHLMDIMGVLFTYFYDENEKTNIKSLERIRYTVNYIHHNFTDDITLTDLAEYTNLSSAYLSSMFKTTLGVNITDYIAQVRMNHAINLMMTDKTITDISYESGFKNPNAMIATFTRYKNMTPSKYREKIKSQYGKKPKQDNIEITNDYLTVFESLFKYTQKDDFVKSVNDIVQVEADLTQVVRKYNQKWNRILNVGYADYLLIVENQREIEILQDEFKFEYLRLKGILDDNMFLSVVGIDGFPMYNYTYINMVIDYVLSIGAKPFIELGHMPHYMISDINFRLRASSHISTPRSIELWSKLVEDLMINFLERYGVDEVSNWLFSPWITIEYCHFGVFSFEDYQKTYHASYKSIKKVLSSAQIVGPGSLIENDTLLIKYLEFIHDKEINVDYFSFKSYATSKEDEAIRLRATPDAFPYAVSSDEDFIHNSGKRLKKILSEAGYCDVPMLIEEWNSNIWQRDYTSDTIFKSCYMTKNVVEGFGDFYAVAYYSLNDKLDEIAPTNEIFSGGFGLFTWNKIPKSSFYAFRFLNELGKDIIYQTEGCMVTRKDKNYQIILYNYVHYDILYRHRHISEMTLEDRYGVFNHKNPVVFQLKLSGLNHKSYQIEKNTISRDHGSPFDQWLKMGAPDKLDVKDIRYLVNKSMPELTRDRIQDTDEIKFNVVLAPHEVVLIKLDIL